MYVFICVFLFLLPDLFDLFWEKKVNGNTHDDVI